MAKIVNLTATLNLNMYMYKTVLQKKVKCPALSFLLGGDFLQDGPLLDLEAATLNLEIARGRYGDLGRGRGGGRRRVHDGSDLRRRRQKKNRLWWCGFSLGGGDSENRYVNGQTT